MELAAFREWTARLHTNLERDPRVLGLVMAGSSAEVERVPDAWSDHDFFVITQPGVQEAFRADLRWLPDAAQIVLSPRETEHGFKVLFADGHLIEFAVFDWEETRRARLNDYRVIFAPPDGRLEAMLAEIARDSAPTGFDREREVGLFLSLLLIGSGRVRRGEILSGQRFIKDFAFAGILRVLANDRPQTRADNLDPFRRVEACYPDLAPELHHALLLEPLAAAAALLDFAEAHLAPLPAPAVAVVRRTLVAR
jgi:hypothetical protein